MNIIKKLYARHQHRKNINSLLVSLDYGQKGDEYFLISYPKSGNTWLRFLIANLLKKDEMVITLKNVGDFVPDVHVQEQREKISDKNSDFLSHPKKFVKTHDEYVPFYEDKKVIYIVRDGRDTINSYFHYINARQEKQVSVGELIKDSSYSRYTGWSNHVIGWKEGFCKSKIFIRYEDLMENPEKEAAKMLKFVNWELPQDKIRKAVGNAAFDNLKNVEEKYGGINEKRTEEGKKTAFFRKGQTNDWQNYFSQDDLKKFWRIHGKGMKAFNYSE